MQMKKNKVYAITPIAAKKKMQKPPPVCHPNAKRLHIGLLLMIGFSAAVLMRTNLSVAMVCMVNSTALTELVEDVEAFANHSNVPSGCQLTQYVVDEYEGDLIWSPSKQSLLFSASFWGALFTAFPAGFMADRYGPKNLLSGAVCIHILVSVMLPFLAKNVGFWAVFCVRILMGLGEGFLIPCMCAIAAHWFPPLERSTFAAIYTSGNQLANVVGNPISAMLCSSEILGGWPAIFYLCALIGCIWLIFWHIIATNSPHECSTISAIEFNYLTASMSKLSLSTGKAERKESTKQIPWKRIFLSLPFIANLIAQFSANFIISMMQAYLPIYFRDVLYLELKSNGLYTALPFLVQLIFKFIWSPLADRLKKSKICSPTLIVKIYQCVASYGSACCLFCLAFFADCTNPALAISLMCVQGACLAAVVPGFVTSLLSLAPPFTGTLISLSLTFGMIGNIAAPIVVGAINKNGSVSEWRTIFILTACLLIFSGTFFTVFASAEMQQWSILQTVDNNKKINSKVEKKSHLIMRL